MNSVARELYTPPSEWLDVSSLDGSVHSSLGYSVQPDGTTVVASSLQRPEGLEDWQAAGQLRRDLGDNSKETSEYKTLDLAIPFIQAFMPMGNFEAVVQALGYGHSVVETHNNGHITEEVTFSYPSLEALNAAAKKYFPTTPLTFVPYPGGEYSGEEFIPRLTEAREILVATEQPHELHDHAVPHLLGWLAMGEDFIDPLCSVLGHYVKRADAERELPAIPEIEDSRIGSFLHPARAALDLAMDKLDELTSRIVDNILRQDEQPTIYRPQEQRLATTLEVFWTEGESSLRARKRIPAGFLGRPGYGFFDDTAQTMWQRYEAAASMVAK